MAYPVLRAEEVQGIPVPLLHLSFQYDPPLPDIHLQKTDKSDTHHVQDIPEEVYLEEKARA